MSDDRLDKIQDDLQDLIIMYTANMHTLHGGIARIIALLTKENSNMLQTTNDLTDLREKLNTMKAVHTVDWAIIFGALITLTETVMTLIQQRQQGPQQPAEDAETTQEEEKP